MNFKGIVDINQTKLYCKINHHNPKSQREVIVFFPGGPGLGFEPYKKYTEILESFAPCLYFDPRDCGNSQKTSNPREYAMDIYLKDARALIKHFEISKVIIVGVSYGSMTALKFAITYPDLLSSLILIGSAPTFRFIDEAKKILKKRGTKQQIEICEKKLWKGAFQNNQELQKYFKIMSSLYSNKIKEGEEPSYNVICATGPLNEAFKTRFWKFNFIPKLKNIHVKTLVLVGEDDWITPPNQSQIIATKIPHAQLHIIKNSGHSIAVDQPKIYKNLIKKFINN